MCVSERERERECVRERVCVCARACVCVVAVLVSFLSEGRIHVKKKKKKKKKTRSILTSPHNYLMKHIDRNIRSA